MGILPVEELGEKIERTWRAVNYDRQAFPDLCATLLDSCQLPSKVDPLDIANFVLAGRLPEQADPGALFGQPPVTIFRSQRFYIDALHWVDATTAIHDHAFSGAFQVLTGSSIETTFSFSCDRDIDGHLRLGALTADGSVLHQMGSVRAIPAGAGYIHSLFHLSRPSVSLVVRTFRDPVVGAQLEYSPAGIGYHSFMDNPVRDRILQMVDMLRKTEHPAFERIVGDAIADADLHTGFSIIQACTKGRDSVMVDRLIDRLSACEHAERIRSWVLHRRRIDFLLSRRRSVHDEELRFFLAVLLNAQRRSDALALVATFTSQMPPEKQIASWVRRLSETTIKLRLESTEFEPSLLGLPKFGSEQEALLASALMGENVPSSDDQRFLEALRKLPPLACLFVQ